MADPRNKWNTLCGTELTAQSGTAEGLDLWPPLTPAQRIAARPPDYGAYFTPPAPVFYTTTNVAGQQVNTPAGSASLDSFRLYWRSNVGAMPADLAKDYMGVRGLDSLGIDGHLLTVTGGPSGFTARALSIPGPRLWAEVGPVPYNPAPASGEPDTPYVVTVYALGKGGTMSRGSQPINCYTCRRDDVEPPPPPGVPPGLSIIGGLPTAPSTGIRLSWEWVNDATTYEVWTNSSTATAIGMDPTRDGLMEGDELAATRQQPGEYQRDIEAILPPVPGGTPFMLKVRAVTTRNGMTARSPFSPIIRGVTPRVTP
ncbi:hypothetical protein ABZ543_12730 [Streptomyces roseifaciens]